MSLHFIHPDECTPEAAQACARLADAGIPLGSQTVLLKDVNDNVETMQQLMHKLLLMRVRPYYLYQCDPISGSSHFRTPVAKGLEIIEGLRGHTTGYAVPTYVIDAPGGGGKIPLQANSVIGRDGDWLLLRNYEGQEYRYHDPLFRVIPTNYMHIGITYDLRSDYLAAGYGEEETAEFDQAGTIDAIDGALCELGHTTDRMGHARNLIERLAAGDRWDLVFNICEGLHGLAREAQVPAILDVYDIPYTFADPAALCVCLDKALTKTVLRAAGVPTPDWHVVRDLSDIERCQLPFPLIAKPLAEGTGKGINAASKITDRARVATGLRAIAQTV